MENLDQPAHPAPQDLPLDLGRLSLDRGGHRGNQGPLGSLAFQGEMDRREPGVIKEIRVREDLKDFKVWLEKLEPKERREIQELVPQDLLASLGLLDPPDHVVYLMDQTPWVLGLMT